MCSAPAEERGADDARASTVAGGSARVGMSTTTTVRLQELTRRGDDIGSWGAKKPGFYQPIVLFDPAERVRIAGYEALNGGRLAEAYVMLLRFTKFYQIILASKPDKSSAKYKELQRKMLMCLDSLENIKARLLKQWGDFAGAAIVGQAVGEPQDEHIADLTHALESRFQKLKAQPPPKPPPPAERPKPPPQEVMPSPAAASPSAGAGADSGVAAATAAAVAAGMTVAGPPAAAGIPKYGPTPNTDDAGGLLHRGAQANCSTTGGGGAVPTPSTHLPPPYPAPSGPPPPASASVADTVAAPAGPSPKSLPGSLVPAPPFVPLTTDPPAASPVPATLPPQAVQPPAQTTAGPSAAPVAAPPPAAAPPQASRAAATATVGEPPTVDEPPPPAYQTTFANTMYPAIARPLRQLPSGDVGASYAPPMPPPAHGPGGSEATVPVAGWVASAGGSQASSSGVEGGADESSAAPPERGMRDQAPGTSGAPARRRPDMDSGPQDARSRLTRHLAMRGFRIMDVPGDNNCQFHALADQLQQLGVTGWSALSLRKKMVQWLQENGNKSMDDGKVGEACKLRDSVGVDNWDRHAWRPPAHARASHTPMATGLARGPCRVPALPSILATGTPCPLRFRYIREMSQHGVTWGDEATLLAASVLFKMEIVVISSLSPDYCHIVTPPDVWKVPLTRRCYLGHFAEFHYVSTRPVGG